MPQSASFSLVQLGAPDADSRKAAYTPIRHTGLLHGRRLDQLRPLAAHPNLVIQTSLDGARAATHDAHRGAGSWARTVAGIEQATALRLPAGRAHRNPREHRRAR